MLVGRTALLETLRDLVAQSYSMSRVIWLVGAEGVGKSALAEQAAASSGLRVLRVDLFPEDRAVRRSAVDALAADLGLELGRDPVADLLVAIEEAGPLCIRIEDAQWLDPESQDILWRFIRRLLTVPVLLLVTSLDDVDGGPLLDGLRLLLRRPERGRIVPVEPLGRAGVAELVSSRLAMPVAGWTLDRIVDVTGGYPAMVVSLVDQLRRAESIADIRTLLRSLISTHTGSGLLRRHADQTIDDADPPLRAALLALGLAQQLSSQQLAHVLRDRGLATVPTAALLDTDLVDLVGAETLRLRYRITEAVIIGRFSPDDVAATHRALGDLLGGRRGLEHRVAGTDRSDSRSLAADLVEEMEGAFRRGDRETMYQMANLAASLDPAHVPDLVFAALWSNQPSRLADHQEVIENLPFSPARMVGMSLLATRGLTLPSVAQVDEHLDLSAGTPDRELMLLAYWLLHGAARAGTTSMAELWVAARPLAEALRSRGQALVTAGERRLGERFLGDALLLELVLEQLFDSDVPLVDRPRRMTALRDRAASGGLTDGIPEADIIINLARGAAGDVRVAAEELANAPDTTNPTLRLEAGLARAHIHFLAGDWDAAHRFAEEMSALALDTLMLDHWQRASDLERLVPSVRDEALERPDLELGQQDAGSPLGQAVRAVVRTWRMVAAGGAAAGTAQVLDELWSTGGVARTGAYLTGVLRVRAHALSDALPRAAAARAELAAQSYAPDGRAYALAHADALLRSARGDVAGARQGFADAAERLTTYLEHQGSVGPMLYAAVLAEDWARLPREQGEEAPESLRGLIDGAALVLAAAGAESWRVRLVGLRAEFVQPSVPPVLHGTDRWRLLSAREREVAELVADGLTNRELASRLFITVRTAEYHVHNILSKLRLRSRHELRASRAAAEAGHSGPAPAIASAPPDPSG